MQPQRKGLSEDEGEEDEWGLAGAVHSCPGVSLCPIPRTNSKAIPKGQFPHDGCGWDRVLVGILLAWQP